MRIGDIVKIKKGFYREGKTGKIVEITPHIIEVGIILYNIEFNSHDRWWFRTSKISLVKPKVETAREKVMF